MKKYFAFLTAFLMFTTVLAADITKKNTYYIEFDPVSGVENKGMAAGFDENNKLVSASLCDVMIGNEICTAEFDMSIPKNGKNIRIYFPNSQTTIKNFKTIEIAGEEIVQPIEPVEPPVNPDIEPDKNDAMSKYPTALDATTAYMVVKSVNQISENDITKTKLTVFFRGEETELLIDEEKTLESAPMINADLKGASLSELKEGDTIYCSSDMSGRIRTVELIARPPHSDIISDNIEYGTNFENIFSLGSVVTTARATPVAIYGGNNSLRQQYAYGLIKDKKDNKFMALCNKKGVAEEEMIIDLTPNTVVYVYDKTKRNNKLSIGTIADIEKSEFDQALIDENDNITSWNKESVHNYALVRMAEGTALDVVVYLNYNG